MLSVPGWRLLLSAVLVSISVLSQTSPVKPAATPSPRKPTIESQPFPISSVPPGFLSSLHWRSIGPYRGGRTRAVAGVPSQPNVFYIGVCNGGVWKTTDYGATWVPIFDDQPTGSIGAIAVAQSDPNVVYVGSGEGLHRPDLSVGDGIYKSTDAGKTWTHLGLRDGQQIPQLAVDPRDPNKVFAAVAGHPYGPNKERGVYRSTDGGQTFQKVLPVIQPGSSTADRNQPGTDAADPNKPATGGNDPNKPATDAANGNPPSTGAADPNQPATGAADPNKPASGAADGNQSGSAATSDEENIGASDVLIDPINPDTVYATLWEAREGPWENGAWNGSGGGIFKSTDGGKTFQRLAGGLPREIIQAHIAIAESNPKRLIASVASNPRGADGSRTNAVALYRSDDAGATWAQITTDPRPAGRIGGGDLSVPRFNPKDPDMSLSPARSPGNRLTAARHGAASAARPAATTTRTSGSIPTIRRP